MDKEVALLLAQQVGFGLQTAADAAALEHRNLVGVALAEDQHVGLALYAPPIAAELAAIRFLYLGAGLQHQSRHAHQIAAQREQPLFIDTHCLS